MGIFLVVTGLIILALVLHEKNKVIEEPPNEPEQDPTPVPNKFIEIASYLLSNPNNPSEPGKGIFIRTGVVIPENSIFRIKTRVGRTDGTSSYGTTIDKTLRSNTLYYTGVTIQEESWYYIRVEIYHKTPTSLTLIYRQTWF